MAKRRMGWSGPVFLRVDSRAMQRPITSTAALAKAVRTRLDRISGSNSMRYELMIMAGTTRFTSRLEKPWRASAFNSLPRTAR